MDEKNHNLPARSPQEFHLRIAAAHRVDAFNSVAFSPDGGWIASVSDDSAVKLWDASSGKPIRSLRGHQNWVLSVAFSPNGRWLASGSYDDTVKLWEVETGAQVETYREISTTHSFLTAEFRPRARIAATADGDFTASITATWEWTPRLPSGFTPVRY
jgi:WD40 repeat protein